MEPESTNPEIHEDVSRWHRVTPFTRYAAMLVFIVLPFLGGWVGYTYAPEKMVEVERVVAKENKTVDLNKIDETVFRDYDKPDEVLFSNDEWNDSYYFVDDSRLFLQQNEGAGRFAYIELVKDIDLDTVEMIAPFYLRDKRNVYLGWTKIESADPVSFELLSENYNEYFGVFAKDANNVYFGTSTLFGVEPMNFRLLEDRKQFGTDGSILYFRNNQLEEIDLVNVKFSNWDRVIQDDDTILYLNIKRCTGVPVEEFNQWKYVPESGIEDFDYYKDYLLDQGAC